MISTSENVGTVVECGKEIFPGYRETDSSRDSAKHPEPQE